MKPNNSVPGIYYYKNKINGKLYIGQAKNLHERQKAIKYERYAGPVFNNALKKYGLKNFEYGILTHCKIEELDYYETFYIKRLKTKIPNGYNMTDGGEGVRGVEWSEEKRQKYRIMYSGENNPNFGNKWNEAQRKRASEYMKKRIKTEGLIGCHTTETAQKCYESFIHNKYGITLEELDNTIKKFVEENNSISFEEIKRKYGFSTKTISLSFKRLGVKNNKSEKLKRSYKHNPFIVQCDRLYHNIVLNIFPSLKVATEKTGIKSIHHCTHGFQENAGGYFWRFNIEGETPSIEYNDKYLKPLEDSRKLTDEQKQKLKEKNVWKKPHLEKKVYCFDKDNNIVNVCKSLIDAGKKYNICYHTIGDICLLRRKNKYVNGITFSYDKNHKVEPFTQTKILQYTLDGKLIKEYDSVKEASKETGAKEGSISSCISGRYKTSLGYIWKKVVK